MRYSLKIVLFACSSLVLVSNALAKTPSCSKDIQGIYSNTHDRYPQAVVISNDGHVMGSYQDRNDIQHVWQGNAILNGESVTITYSHLVPSKNSDGKLTLTRSPDNCSFYGKGKSIDGKRAPDNLIFYKER